MTSIPPYIVCGGKIRPKRPTAEIALLARASGIGFRLMPSAPVPNFPVACAVWSSVIRNQTVTDLLFYYIVII